MREPLRIEFPKCFKKEYKDAPECWTCCLKDWCSSGDEGFQWRCR